MTPFSLGSRGKSLGAMVAVGLMLAAVAFAHAGIAVMPPPMKVPGAIQLATSERILLSLFPIQNELMRLVRGRTYRLEEVLREPLRICNMSEQDVEVELKALSLSEAGIRPEAGCADLVGRGTVVISPATFTLKPREERTVEGTLSLLKPGPKGKALMCVIAATVAHQETKTQTETYSRIYVQAK